jgi:Zn-dependent protease
MELTTLQKIILWLIPMIFAITVHEVAHGYVANKLGDPTAKMMGRLTLNPIKHIDLVGTIIIPGLLLWLGGFFFGYAKPVPVDWRNLRHFRRDMVLVALAGPLANLLMAFIWAAVTKFSIVIYSTQSPYWGTILGTMSSMGVAINIMLLVLNLIPIPPLDGSRVVMGFLRGQAALNYAKIEPYGFFILLGLLALGFLSHIMTPFVMFFTQIINQLFGIGL